MNANSIHAAPAIEESYQEYENQAELDAIIDQLVEAGFLVPSVGIGDCINAWEPYDFRVRFDSLSSISGYLYIRQLRRLFRSVNLRLRRQVGFPAKSDTDVSKALQMITGYVIIQSHKDRPCVEVVCNVNSRYSVIDVAIIRDAFLNTGCYQSVHNPQPLFDKSTLDVTYLTEGVWDTELLDPDPYVFSLNGRRLMFEC